MLRFSIYHPFCLFWGVQAAMATPEGQVRVCEAVLECVRLICSYSAYLHAYSALTSAPFSVLLLVSERHSRVRFII